LKIPSIGVDGVLEIDRGAVAEVGTGAPQPIAALVGVLELDDGATLGTYNPDPGRGIGAGGGTGFLPIPTLLAPKVSADFTPVAGPVGTFDDIERIDEAAVLLVPVAIVPLELDVALLLRLALPVDSRIESDAVEPDPTVNAELEPDPTVDTAADADEDPTNAGLFTANPLPVLSLLVLVGIGVGIDAGTGTGTDIPTGTGGGSSCPPPSPCPYPSLDTDPLLEVCDGRRLTSLCGFGVGLMFTLTLTFGVGVGFCTGV